MNTALPYRVLLSAFVLATGLTGCEGLEQSSAASVQQEIVDGTITTARPGVVQFNTPAVFPNCSNRTGPLVASSCTAVVVAPRYLLTASHCVNYLPSAVGGSITMHLNNGRQPAGSPFPVNQTFGFWRPSATHTICDQGGVGMYDVALVQLTNPLPANLAVPATIASISSLEPENDVEVTAMGYGCEDRSPFPAGTGAGLKRFASFTWPRFSGLCPGDTGGPVFLGAVNASGALIRINSGLSNGSAEFGNAVYFRERIEEMIRQLEGGLEHGKNRPGLDFTNFSSPSAQSCRDQCTRDPRCDAFSFVPGTQRCWLKNGVPTGTFDAAVISGLPARQGAFDRGGSDFTNHPSPSADSCEADCARNARCRAYTFVGATGTCWLKDSVPAAGDGCPTCVSGDNRGLDVGIDRPGPPYRSLTSPDFTIGSCAFSCELDPECRVWIRVASSKTCIMKDVVPPAVVASSDITSAVKRGLEYNVDRPGGDLPGSPITFFENFPDHRRPELCQQACPRQEGCVAWTMDNEGRCWRKGTITPAVYAPGMVSGRRGLDSF